MIPKKSAPSAPAVQAPAVASGELASGQSQLRAPAAKGTKPTHILKFKEGKDGKFVRITGLFQDTTKSGEVYWKGTDKENNVTYVVMPNTYEAK